MIKLFPEADIIFLEGMKESNYPKIEVIRGAVSEQPVSNPEGRFLIVTDRAAEEFEESSVGLEEINIIIERILEVAEWKKNE